MATAASSAVRHTVHPPCRVSDDVLHVIVPYSNSAGFARRRQLFYEFMRRMREFEEHGDLGGATILVYVVETRLRGHDFEVTEVGHPRHLRLDAEQEVWTKEASINLAVRTLLPRDWRYVAWVDSDITFNSDNWVSDTLARLQQHAFLQLFQSGLHLNAEGGVDAMYESFAYRWAQHSIAAAFEPVAVTGAALVAETAAMYAGDGNADGAADYYHGGGGRRARKQQHAALRRLLEGHPGFAWAMTRRAWATVGGLIDFAIFGSADRYMALSLVGMGEVSLPHGCHADYRADVLQWEKRAAALGASLGYVPGTVLHHFHGRQEDRRYNARNVALVRERFSPREDVVLTSQGLLHIRPERYSLLRALHNYAVSRNEDSR
jgi:hypothetical protein